MQPLSATRRLRVMITRLPLILSLFLVSQFATGQEATFPQGVVVLAGLYPRSERTQ